jgi:hypothetical protein
MEQRVLQFEYQQSLVQETDRSGWSEIVTVSIRLLSEAITSGWYRLQFANRGNDFVILLAIAMHARPLKGDDLIMLVNLHMATQEDEGRLYARVSDAALADELGMSRMTIARATRRLAEDKSIHMVEIPEKLFAFRDSHGRFNGKKVYLIAGDIQSRFLEKSIEKVNHATKSSTVKDNPATKKCIPVPNSSINVINDEDDEEGTASFIQRVFSYFARRKGDLDYHPTIKEQIALEKLFRDGFSFEQMIAGIDVAFIRPSRPRYFTHCAAITRDLIRFQQETRTAEASQPGIRKPENLTPSDQLECSTVEVIESHLAHAVDVYRSSGRDINGDLLARFRLMAGRCDRAARLAGTNGGEWLAAALACGLGVAHPRNLLNYADAVLSDWMINGHDEKPAAKKGKSSPPRCKSSKANREPAAHDGIRLYLEKHGGIPDGYRD